MALTFKIDTERITIGEYADITSLGTDNQRLIEIYARHMINGDGEYMNLDAALILLRSLPYSQLDKITKQFIAAWKEAKNEAVPPATKTS